jgi:beta-N-acetylhexosaminidase
MLLISAFKDMCRHKRLILIFLAIIIGISVNASPGNSAETDQELRNKIGQMLLLGFRGTQIYEDSYISKVIKDINIGGVILFDYDVPSQSFPRNIINPEQTKKLISGLQAYAKTPLFVAVDAEGGHINRLKEKYGFLKIPSAKEIGNINPKKAKFIYEKLAGQLAGLGFNLNLAPVVDVNINPENPVIGSLQRSFSTDHQTVIDYALAFINAHNRKGVISALKHFPGHGSSRHDSHLDLVDVTETYKNYELTPYKELIKKGKAEMIMTAHIMNRQVDSDYPATLSPNFLQKILRDNLDFKGVIISDDMQMGAITKNYSFSEAVIRAVNAGCNILAISNNGKSYDYYTVYKAFKVNINALKSVKIPINKIHDSYTKILYLKKKFKIN